MTLGDDTTLLVERRYFIGTVPSTVLTPDTRRVVMPNDTVVKFDVAFRWAAYETLRLYTVVTAHGVEKL